jgi:RNA polymerase sigma-70 factor (ECF subfamily)
VQYLLLRENFCILCDKNTQNVGNCKVKGNDIKVIYEEFRKFKRKNKEVINKMSKNESIEQYLNHVFRYYNDVYRIIISVVCEHYLAEELTQVVMVKAWNGFHNLRNPESSKAWLKMITRNVIREYMRKKMVFLSISDRKVFIEMETKELQNIEYDILDAIVKKEAIERVFKALNSLETVYSEIIRYHVMGGFSLKDVADILKMNYGTVRCYYSKGMKLLRDIYYKLEEEDRFKIK